MTKRPMKRVPKRKTADAMWYDFGKNRKTRL